MQLICYSAYLSSKISEELSRIISVNRDQNRAIKRSTNRYPLICDVIKMIWKQLSKNPKIFHNLIKIFHAHLTEISRSVCIYYIDNIIKTIL